MKKHLCNKTICCPFWRELDLEVKPEASVVCKPRFESGYLCGDIHIILFLELSTYKHSVDPPANLMGVSMAVSWTKCSKLAESCLLDLKSMNQFLSLNCETLLYWGYQTRILQDLIIEMTLVLWAIWLGQARAYGVFIPIKFKGSCAGGWNNSRDWLTQITSCPADRTRTGTLQFKMIIHTFEVL